MSNEKEKANRIAELIVGLSLNPWYAIQYRKDPTAAISTIPHLNRAEYLRLIEGHRGVVTQILDPELIDVVEGIDIDIDIDTTDVDSSDIDVDSVDTDTTTNDYDDKNTISDRVQLVNRQIHNAQVWFHRHL